MGLRDKRQALIDERAGREARDESPEHRFEFDTLNLHKVPDLALAAKLNEYGARGYRVVGVTDSRVILQREA